jgi:hypothetical protein
MTEGPKHGSVAGESYPRSHKETCGTELSKRLITHDGNESLSAVMGRYVHNGTTWEVSESHMGTLWKESMQYADYTTSVDRFTRSDGSIWQKWTTTCDHDEALENYNLKRRTEHNREQRKLVEDYSHKSQAATADKKTYKKPRSGRTFLSHHTAIRVSRVIADRPKFL